MDSWAWSDHLAPWLACRAELPIGALFCVIDGPTRGRPWSATAARGELRRYALAAGVRRRFAPYQLRHAHAVELAREGVPLPVIQRQLGHSYVSTTSVYLQGIDVEEIIGTIRSRWRSTPEVGVVTAALLWESSSQLLGRPGSWRSFIVSAIWSLASSRDHGEADVSQGVVRRGPSELMN
jgi:integrase/recombinase XerD